MEDETCPLLNDTHFAEYRRKAAVEMAQSLKGSDSVGGLLLNAKAIESYLSGETVNYETE